MLQLCVCLSQAGIVSKWLNVGSKKTILNDSPRMQNKRSPQNSDGINPNGRQMQLWVGKIVLTEREVSGSDALPLGICSSDTVVHVHDDAGMCSVINNVGRRQSLLITPMAHFSITCMKHRSQAHEPAVMHVEVAEYNRTDAEN